MSRRVLLKSPLNPLSGYGRDGIGLALALEKLGSHTMLSPVNLTPPLPPEVAFMLTRPLEPPFDMLLNHVDPAQISLSGGDRRSAYQTVAWTMWEFLDLTEQLRAYLTEALEPFDVVVSYDETSAEALAPVLREGQRSLMIQGGYDPEPWQSDDDAEVRNWDDGPLRFGMAGVLNLRKNPFAAVRAFERVHEKYPDTELHLKTNDRTLHPKMEERWPGLHVHYSLWSEEQMLDYYRHLHVYIGPSWGEGKNLPAMEAATTGAVPLLSDCGGHRAWLDSTWGYLTPTTIQTHQGMRYAAVDEEALYEQMVHIIENRSEAREKGIQAARQLPGMMNWTRVTRRLLDAL